MSALPGTHLCKDHQGNHSHYDKENCEICKLRKQVAEQSAALKLARAAAEAIVTYQELLESGKPRGLINAYGQAYEASVTALAAIDALGE